MRDDADQFRLDVAPSPRNGLREASPSCRPRRADDALLLRVNRALALFLSIV
jgi:mRNA interferase MazF